ncbi:MAG: hypothetical protein ACKO7G_07995 [Gammaproteobacteria bacterium]
MRDLVLILPDLLLTDAELRPRGASRPIGLTRLRFAQASPLRGGWRSVLARGVGRADLVAVDPAEVVAAAMGSAATGAVAGAAPSDTGPRDPWLVAPLHLMAGLKTVHLAADGLLRLPPDEAAELAAAHDAVFGVDGVTLRPAGAAGFLLEGLEAAVGAVAVEPQRLLGGALDDALPSGPGGPALRAWITETEMWLHGLPLNRRREARGEPRVTTLWPWGGGNPLREPLAALPAGTAAKTARWPRVWSDDAWVVALAALAGVVVEPVPRVDAAPAMGAAQGALAPLLAADEHSGCVVVSVVGTGLEALDRALIAPAARAVAEGRLERFTIAADDRAVHLARAERWRVWRPRRDLLEAVSEGGA